MLDNVQRKWTRDRGRETRDKGQEMEHVSIGTEEVRQWAKEE
jgi:hypothetical protein